MRGLPRQYGVSGRDSLRAKVDKNKKYCQRASDSTTLEDIFHASAIRPNLQYDNVKDRTLVRASEHRA